VDEAPGATERRSAPEATFAPEAMDEKAATGKFHAAAGNIHIQNSCRSRLFYNKLLLFMISIHLLLTHAPKTHYCQLVDQKCHYRPDKPLGSKRNI
jgi:hypothetical protein